MYLPVLGVAVGDLGGVKGGEGVVPEGKDVIDFLVGQTGTSAHGFLAVPEEGLGLQSRKRRSRGLGEHGLGKHHLAGSTGGGDGSKHLDGNWLIR